MDKKKWYQFPCPSTMTFEEKVCEWVGRGIGEAIGLVIFLELYLRFRGIL